MFIYMYFFSFLCIPFDYLYVFFIGYNKPLTIFFYHIVKDFDNSYHKR